MLHPLPTGGDTGGGGLGPLSHTSCQMLLDQITRSGELIAEYEAALKTADAHSPQAADYTRGLNLASSQLATLRERYQYGGCTQIPVHNPASLILHSPIFCDQTVFGAILDKWEDLDPAAQNLLGLPTGGAQTIDAPTEERHIQFFDHGAIVSVEGGDGAFVVWMDTFVRYAQLGHAGGVLGAPLADASPIGGGTQQRFTGGTIFHHPSTWARAVPPGALADHWQAHGGCTGSLGFPLSEVMTHQVGNNAVAWSLRCQGGVIYQSASTKLVGHLNGPLLLAYEMEHGGATGALGLPTGSIEAADAHGRICCGFDGGVLVHDPAGIATTLSAGSTSLFRSRRIFLDSFNTSGDDTVFDTDQDLYVYVTIQASNGPLFRDRMPPSDTFPNSHPVIKQTLATVSLTPSTTIACVFDGWDADTFSSDDRLGTVSYTFSKDNLWGDAASDLQPRNGDFYADFSCKEASQVYDSTKNFRNQWFWQFDNFTTAELSWLQYSQTFNDISQDESVIRHPFDHLFYTLAFKSVSDQGNCFGFCLDSVYAQIGRSLYTEPVFGQVTADAPLINELNIMNGYQLGAATVGYVLEQFLSGATHSPVATYKKCQALMAAGDYPLLSLTDDTFGSSSHCVRVTGFIDDVGNAGARKAILVANPNAPWPVPDTDARSRVIVDFSNNTFSFAEGHDAQGEPIVWSGGDWSGGRMFAIPFSLLCTQPSTPFWEVIAGIVLAGALIIMGGDGSTSQIEDSRGRSYYDPETAGLPTRWDQIQKDPARAIPTMSRIPIMAGSGSATEIYASRGNGETLIHSIVGGEGVFTRMPYSWNFCSIPSTISVSAIGSLAADRITVSGLSTGQQVLNIRAGSTKVFDVQLQSIQGKTFQFAELAIPAGSAVTIRITQCGQAIELMPELHLIGTLTTTTRPVVLTEQHNLPMITRPVEAFEIAAGDVLRRS